MYNLEISKIINEINIHKANLVLLQFPDGLKIDSNKVVDQIEEETKAKVVIWLGSCYGACDIPLGMSNLNIDLIVQFGHNRFNKKKW